MFTELPKLLDRNYVVGFLLPAAVLSAVAWWVLAVYGLVPPLPAPDKSEALAAGSLAIVAIWLVSILLVALNAQADRLLQGYGWRRLGLLVTFEKEKFERDVLPVLDQQKAFDAAVAAGTTPVPLDPVALANAVSRYPDEAEWLLPTRYGNRIRAAEVYGRAVYRLEAVTGSYRISSLLPAEFRELLSGARAQLDFCISLVVGGVLAGALFLGLAAYRGAFGADYWPAAAAAAMIAIGYALAVQLAMPYGAYLRAAFDLGRGPLAEALGLVIPADPVEEQRMWEAVSRMFTYRSRANFEKLGKYRATAEAAPDGEAGKAGKAAGRSAPAARAKAAGKAGAKGAGRAGGKGAGKAGAKGAGRTGAKR